MSPLPPERVTGERCAGLAGFPHRAGAHHHITAPGAIFLAHSIICFVHLFVDTRKRMSYICLFISGFRPGVDLFVLTFLLLTPGLQTGVLSSEE